MWFTNTVLKGRLLKVLKVAGLTGLFLLACYFIFSLNIGTLCIFKRITGLNCPSCGITRMGISLMRGDIKSAFRYNQLITVLLPLFAIYILFYLYRYLKLGTTKLSRWENVMMIIVSVVLILYAIVRNLPFYPYPL